MTNIRHLPARFILAQNSKGAWILFRQVHPARNTAWNGYRSGIARVGTFETEARPTELAYSFAERLGHKVTRTIK